MIFTAEERRQMPVVPTEPLRKSGDGDGPGKPDVKRPDTSDLLKRMRRVDPDAARRYRQRSGQ
ncbi:MAG: ubiquitin-like protein UBact [Chloroherpetonaceae bacterium]|nr:ubiquitin-like protein UBact [Chthonomonadaceae bacterium]MDW8208848.1 ubiquitin-like protein UBact [Chloroherpetonaceae bacterium]